MNAASSHKLITNCEKAKHCHGRTLKLVEHRLLYLFIIWGNRNQFDEAMAEINKKHRDLKPEHKIPTVKSFFMNKINHNFT